MNCRNIKVVLNEFKREVEKIRYDCWFYDGGYVTEYRKDGDNINYDILEEIIEKLEKDLDCG